MAHYNFKKDLAVSKKTEKRVAEILEDLYDAEILEFGDDIRYDILTKINDVEVSFEVKEDFMCKKTGNVSLEFSCRGKPSGIEATEADCFIYVVHTKDDVEYFLFETETLKEMVERKNYFRIVNGGDKGSNTLNYLFKYEIFDTVGHKLPLDKIK